jgi:NAD(P)-dependent dehydrogenase (short-subunit alcohol dehydrogenase family)
MNGKVVLVTGANGGLGTAVTRAFLDAGATVVGTSLKIQQDTFNDRNFTALPADISKLDDARRLIGEIDRKVGKLDVLAHTVGGFAGGQTVAETDDATFQRMFDMNVKTTLNVLRAAIPQLVRNDDSRIIAIGSRQALDPGKNVGAYSASKAAMVSLIQTVALENKDAGLKANVVLPGTMDTAVNRRAMPKADFSKWVQPSSVASLMVWLAGDGGKDVNGAVIPVYGPEG